jgi:hypothetical protein
MQNSNNSPEELNPTNGNENNANLQNNSEENKQDADTEKKSPVRVPGMIEKMIEESEQKESEINEQTEEMPIVPRRDPSVWEHKSDDTEDNTEENSDQESNANDEKRIRDYKGSNRKLAGLRRTKSQKQKKYDRLVSEMNDLKAEQKRGYRIVENADGQIKHNPIESSERLVISFKISDLDYERFMLRIEIQILDQKIKSLASRKRSNSITKKEKAVRSKQENDLVGRVSKELTEASKNGSKEIVTEIQHQIQSGKRNEAYKSLKSFLSEEVKPVAKKLNKSTEMEKNVLERVLDKLSPAQS